MIYTADTYICGTFLSLPHKISMDHPCLFQAERLGTNFKELLSKKGEKEVPMKEMVEKLMMNTVKDDESMLPHIHPPEWEYPLSSVFVDSDSPLVSTVTGLPNIIILLFLLG